MLHVRLPEDLTTQLHRHFVSLVSSPDDIDSQLARLLQTSALFPVDFLKNLLAYRAAPQAPDALLISGMPIDADLPPTPTDTEQPPYKPAGVSECSILTIAILLGEPVAYRAEKEGA